MENSFEKILFLDVDGVLNTSSARLERGADAIMPDLLAIVARIIRETGAKIVISSTWRLNPLDMELLRNRLAGEK